MSIPEKSLSTDVAAWLKRESTVRAALLFGSSARIPSDQAPADDWSDVDLHVVTTRPDQLERVDWARELPGHPFCLQAVRPATGGVRKVTALFHSGQIDLVIVPARQLGVARLAMRCGLHRRSPRLQAGFNEIATCLNPGYRFIKGEEEWGTFYAAIVAEMPGVRLGDDEGRALANTFLCDFLWVLQKLERGELAAAQFMLHRSLSEANFRLIRELRLRRGQSLPSFGLGRRVETLLTPEELRWVRVAAGPQAAELRKAAWDTFAGLKALMAELVPTWTVPPRMEDLLAPHSIPR